jgi:hypothetical protein
MLGAVTPPARVSLVKETTAGLAAVTGLRIPAVAVAVRAVLAAMDRKAVAAATAAQGILGLTE